MAPLQFAFYTGTQFPEMYRGGVFSGRSMVRGIALRETGIRWCSWDLKWKDERGSCAVSNRFCAEPGGKECERAARGHHSGAGWAVLVSDDGAQRIYRISYGK